MTTITKGALTAAAQRYTVQTAKAKQAGTDQGWQTTAWDFYSTTPEVRFGATWIGNAMSAAKLYAGRRLADGSIERAPEEHPAARLVAEIAGGVDGQAQLLKAFGPHLVVAGEGWIVVRPSETRVDTTTGVSVSTEEWHVLSVLEMANKGSGLEAEIEGAVVPIPPYDANKPDETIPLAIRVWDHHPRRHLEADSPVRASLELLEELRLLNAAVKAITRSRLTGRGVLLIPQGARFPTQPGKTDAEDDLIDIFMQVAETAYRDPESAAATVPIILEVPAESIGDIKRLTFESDFDSLAIQLREEAIRRFANGLEIPAEILLGLGDVNHWGVWSLKEEAIKLGIEPRLDTVAHALTTQYLRPSLESEHLPDAAVWIVAVDTAPLRVNSNRPQTALEVHAVGAISDEALRRETGFNESDAPSAENTNTVTDTTGPAESTGEALPVDEITTVPSLAPAPAAVPPARVSPDALMAAADGLIWNALTRAGEKLRRTPVCPRSRRTEANQIAAAALHTLLPIDGMQIDKWGLLDDAFDRVPEIAARYGTSSECLTASLDAYCRDLLVAGQEHSWPYVASVVGTCTGEAA